MTRDAAPRAYAGPVPWWAGVHPDGTTRATPAPVPPPRDLMATRVFDAETPGAGPHRFGSTEGTPWP